MLSWFIVGMLFLVVLWATFFVLYQLGLAIVYLFVQDKPVAKEDPQKRFAVIIPAHNEEMTIGTALESWKRMQYPRNLFEVYVIADNCTDQTSEIARAHEAACFTRQDTEKTGKGRAIAWALETIPLYAHDAVVIVDADTTVSPEFLTVMNNRLVSGSKVIQGYDGVLNPDDSCMTRLMQITNVMKNLLFNHAKSKVGLSVQLMGTGMCFDRLILQQVGWKAFSKGEDGEQFAYLTEAGIQIEYEPKAIVHAQEASSFGQAYTQRIRWASARMQLVGLGIELLVSGLRKCDLRLIDAALTYLIPNYAMLSSLSLIGFGITLLADLSFRHVFLLWFIVLLGGQILYLALGVALSRPSIKTLTSLSFAPVFLLWKMAIDLIALLRLNDSVWVRTSRVSPKEKQTPINYP